MGLGSRLRSLYFDRVYTPVYDLTVARLAPYRHLQHCCLERLGLRPGDAVLSVGVGTGNEVARLLEGNGRDSLSLVGVDISRPGLVRAYGKARRCGQEMSILQMDAQRLGLRPGSFDRALCLHTMDFVADDLQATREIFRVLKKGGGFVITYPAGRGGAGLVGEVAKSVWGRLRRGKLGEAAREALASLGAALAYIPLAPWVKPRHGFYSRRSLERMLASLGVKDYSVDEDPAYQDFIVWGKI